MLDEAHYASLMSLFSLWDTFVDLIVTIINKHIYQFHSYGSPYSYFFSATWYLSLSRLCVDANAFICLFAHRFSIVFVL